MNGESIPDSFCDISIPMDFEESPNDKKENRLKENLLNPAKTMQSPKKSVFFQEKARSSESENNIKSHKKNSLFIKSCTPAKEKVKLPLPKPRFTTILFSAVESPWNDKNKNNAQEKEEEHHQKEIEFNEAVEDMAKYYTDSEQLSFKFSHVWETFFIHLIYFVFGPICVPFLIKIYGKNFPRNLGLWGKKVLTSNLIQVFFWFSFITTMVLSIVIMQSPESSKWHSQYLYLTPAYIAQVLVFIRYSTVCVKYGFYPPLYYKRFKTERLTRTEVKTNFLCHGWIRPSILVLDSYLKEIFQEFSIDPQTFKLQFVGKISDKLKEDLEEVDNLMNEDERRLRLSFYRRKNKESRFYSVIKETLKEKRPSLSQKLIKSLIKNSSLGSKNIELTDVPNILPTSSSEPRRSKIESPLKSRFKSFIKNKVIPDIKRKKKEKLNPLEGKIKKTSEFCYEIKGIYLCRIILKNICRGNLSKHNVILKIIVALSIIIPYLFIFIYFTTKNSQKSQITVQNATQSATQTSTDTASAEAIKFNELSAVLLALSFIAVIAPTWLNALNLIYGTIDVVRKTKLTRAITEMIDANLSDQNRTYPLLNIFDPSSMLNWYYLRIIFTSYGRRFNQRILYQASLFCMFVLLALISSLLAFLGYLGDFVAMCLGSSLTFLILINFMLIFKMFLSGADFNWFEYIHTELILGHKLFLNELTTNPTLLGESNHYFNGCSNSSRETLSTIAPRSKKSTKTTKLSEEKIISNNKKGDIFYQIISKVDEKTRKEKIKYTLKVLENIKEKIRADGIAKPLKIFWVKADYALIGQILALTGTGIAMLLSTLLSTVDFTKYLNNIKQMLK
jgi:hypothetical protein